MRGLNAIEMASTALSCPLRSVTFVEEPVVDPVVEAERLLGRRRRSTFLVLVRQVVGEELATGRARPGWPGGWVSTRGPCRGALRRGGRRSGTWSTRSA
jgi:hypothetical protein